MKTFISLKNLGQSPHTDTNTSIHIEPIHTKTFCKYLVGDKLSNAFISPDPEPPTVSILYGQSEICFQRGFFFCDFLL